MNYLTAAAFTNFSRNLLVTTAGVGSVNGARAIGKVLTFSLASNVIYYLALDVLKYNEMHLNPFTFSCATSFSVFSGEFLARSLGYEITAEDLLAFIATHLILEKSKVLKY